MYEHKIFFGTSIVCLVIIAINSIFYFKYCQDVNITFALKLIPTWLLISNVIIYFVIYRLNLYALLVIISLLFCMVGDILLFLVQIKLEKLILITGGLCFSIARSVICTALFLHPYSNHGDFVLMTKRKILVNSLFPIVFLITFITIFACYINDISMLVMISFYILIMSIQLFIATLRIYGFEGESLISQILSLMSVICFNISDILLIHNMFMTPWAYEDKISICFYWLSLFLLVISIVRNKVFNVENGNSLYAHNLLN